MLLLLLLGGAACGQNDVWGSYMELYQAGHFVDAAAEAEQILAACKPGTPEQARAMNNAATA